jgi:filamentous hemagglutinin family protein
VPPAAQAQAILEDGTLGAESSVVTRDVLIRGILSDRIDGGARRGANLFHSFEQFNIDTGRGAYFANPAGVEAIFSRVTGGNPSNILGRLGVLGSADLYFLNPNGILFGPAASLDLQGSFLATTASGFQFGDLGRFSATAPEVPSALLTINPSALFFNQVAAGTIVNRSVTPVAPGNPFLVGLRVPNGQSLTLLGGDVQVEGGRLSAFGGRIDIGAVAAGGTVQLNPNGSLVIPDGLARGDVTFTDGAIVDVLLGDKGDINVTARNISLLGDSELQAGIASTFGAEGSQAGDLRLNATGTVRIAEDSLVRNRVNENAIGNAGNVEIVANQLELLDTAQISTSTLGQGNAGNVILTVGDRILLDGGDIFSRVGEETLALDDSIQLQGGNIQITTGSLVLINGAQLLANTEGQGSAGSILIRAREDVTFQGRSPTDTSLPSAAFVRVDEGARGRGGNIDIQARNLFVLDGARLFAGTLGTGDSGNILINATNQVRFAGTGAGGQTTVAFTNVEEGGIGRGGNISITAETVNLADGAQLIASTNGQGDAGSITIRATGDVTFRGRSPNGVLPTAAFSRVGEDGQGNGGNIDIQSRNLFVLDGARLTAGTLGRGDSGDLIINATGRVRFAGNSPTGQNSVAFTNVETDSIGRGGNISITAEAVEFLDGAQLVASTEGQGDAGSVTIRAAGDVTFRGRSANNQFPSAVFSRIGAGGRGQGGNIDIRSRNLFVLDGARLFSGTLGQGNSGDIIINATGRVRFAGTGPTGQASVVFANTEGNAVGDGGNISLTANVLEMTDGAQLVASTSAEGNAGDVVIRVGDRILLDGKDTSIFTRINAETLALDDRIQLRGGTIDIETGSLSVLNGAQLLSNTNGQGDAGDVLIRASGDVLFQGLSADQQLTSAIFSRVDNGATGSGGSIYIQARNLFVLDGARLFSGTLGKGNSGDITINATGQVRFAGTGPNGQVSVAFSNVEDNGVGNGGNINITAETLELQDGAQLVASTDAQGNAGGVTIRATGDVTLQGRSPNGSLPSAIFSRVGAGGQGNGSSIDIQARNLFVLDGARLFAGTLGRGDSGDIIINITGQVRFARTGPNGQVSVAFSNVEGNAVGNGGDISITANRLELADGAQFVASTGARGNAGDVILRVGDRILLDGSGTAIFSSVGADTLALDDDVRLRGGAIDIETGSLFLTNGASLVANTAGRGNAGRVTILAGRVSLRGTDTSIFSNVQSGAVGRGGTVRIQTGSLSIRRGAQLVANTAGEGNAGNIRITATGNARLAGFTNETGRSSGLFTNTRFGAQGRGGEIFIRANRLRIQNGAVIYALSENNRPGGSIRLSFNEFEATGGGQVIASALRRGRAGSITLEGGDILFSGSDPTVGDRREKFGTAVANTGDGQSGLFADTQPNSRGRGGSITLRGNSLQVLDSATISAQTAGQGDAGDINIAIRGGTQLSNGNITAAGRFAAGGNITLSTSSLNLTERAAITAANTGGRTAGNITLIVGDRTSLTNSNITAASRRDAGGNITLNTGSLFLTERAAITAASRGRGTAGTIRINTGDRLEMSDGDITTRAPRSSGGNIEINTGSRSTRSLMVLEGDSDITTNSRGDGGNITIGGAGVVAFDDSDLISQAAEGRGGNITLPPFFSETNPPGSANDFDRNDQVDLNASGQTAPGQIITPDTSSVQNSLTPLADASIDEGRLLANSCVVRDRQSGRFIITGSGGLPYAPGDASLSPFPTGDVQPLPETTPEPLPQSRSWQSGDPIIEPQGVYELTDGRLVLSRECDSETTL